MSPPHPLFAFGRRAIFGLACALTALAAPAAAEIISDDVGDFAPTYVGARIDQLDIREAAAVYFGDSFGFVSNHSFETLSDPGDVTPIYVWGIDRGAGQERLVGGSPSVGQGIFFDALLVLTVSAIDGVSASVTTFAPGGAVTTALGFDNAFAAGDLVGAFLSADLLPSTGFDLADYRFNLWTRDAGGNVHIADFARDGGMFAAEDLSPGAVPEPTTWALMLAGFGLAGATLRRRRAIAAA